MIFMRVYDNKYKKKKQYAFKANNDRKKVIFKPGD